MIIRVNDSSTQVAMTCISFRDVLSVIYAWLTRRAVVFTRPGSEGEA